MRWACGSATSPIRPTSTPSRRKACSSSKGSTLWIVDALRYKPHPSHFSVDEALAWIEKLRPRRAMLTNLHTDLDYEELKRRLPETVTPAYDGMHIEVAVSDNV